MGMLLRRKLKALSENATTTSSLGLGNSKEIERDTELPFSDADISFETKDAGIYEEEENEMRRRGRPKKSEM